MKHFANLLEEKHMIGKMLAKPCCASQFTSQTEKRANKFTKTYQ